MDKFEDQINKMKHLMAFKGINETNISNYKKIEHSEIGGDGNTYAIIRENTKFIIKKSAMDKPVLAEDFEYIGGFTNRKNNSFDSYSLALKQFDLKLRSINEKYSRKNAVVESFNPEFYQDNAVKSTDDMKKEIIRQRQIMENASKIGISEDNIDMFKYKDYKHDLPETPKKSNGIASDNSAPFINAVDDTDLNKPTDNIKTHKMQSNPFEEEVIEDNQEDKSETTSKSPEKMGNLEKLSSKPKDYVANKKLKNESLNDFYKDDHINGDNLKLIDGDNEVDSEKDDHINGDRLKSIDGDNEVDSEKNDNGNNLDGVISNLQKALDTLEELNLNKEEYDYDSDIEGIDTKIHEDYELYDDDDDDEPTYVDDLEKYDVKYIDDDEKIDEPYKFDSEDDKDDMAFPIPSKVKYVADDKPNLKGKIFVYGGPGKKGNNKSYIFNIKDEDEEYLVPTSNLELVKNEKETNEDKINDYGHHPEYGKEAMNISGNDKKNGYGKIIGAGDPFDINLIVDGVIEELKRMNIVKESFPEKKK